MKAVIGRSLSGRTPGELGDKGSLQGMRGGERFYRQGRRLSQVFPYKEKSVGSGWCPRAPCRYLIGPGCPTFHPGLFVIGQGASVLSGYFLLNGGGEE